MGQRTCRPGCRAASRRPSSSPRRGRRRRAGTPGPRSGGLRAGTGGPGTSRSPRSPPSTGCGPGGRRDARAPHSPSLSVGGRGDRTGGQRDRGTGRREDRGTGGWKQHNSAFTFTTSDILLKCIKNTYFVLLHLHSGHLAEAFILGGLK